MPEMKQSTERWKKIRAKVFVAWIEKNEKKNYLETTNHF